MKYYKVLVCFSLDYENHFFLLNSVGRLFCTFTVSIQNTLTTWPLTRGRLDLAVLSSTPNRQNRNQVRRNTGRPTLYSYFSVFSDRF